MTMKEDILEQIAEGWLLSRGYFVQHNLKFRPRKSHPDFVTSLDSVPSDIDVLGFHPLKDGPERVVAITCKSYQQGFHPAAFLGALQNNKNIGGRPAWKSFRELVKPKWSEAFIDTVFDATGTREFTYTLAVTRLTGTRYMWEDIKPYSEAMNGNPIKLITLEEMIKSVMDQMTSTPASTDVMRILQLMKAADLKIERAWES